MKSVILFVALLAIASAFAHGSHRVNFKDVYVGFTEELEFTQEQHQQLRECATELGSVAHKFFGKGKTALTKQALGFLFADNKVHRQVITTAFQWLQTGLPACKQFASSMSEMFSNAGVSEVEQGVPAKKLPGFRLARHADIVISTLVSIHDSMKNGDGESVGDSIAYLLEIATGLWHPETIQDYIKNYQQPIEVSVLDVDTFIQKTINEAAKTTGSKIEVSIHRIKAFREAVEFFVQTLKMYRAAKQSTHGVVERQILFFDYARDLVKSGAVALENAQLIMTPFLKEHNFHLSSLNNRHLLARIAHDYYLHLPYIQERVVDISMGARAHHPVQTGHAIGSIIALLARKF